MAEQVGRRPYQRTVSRTFWFLEHPRYIRYMLREVTCLFVGGCTVVLLVGFIRLAQGRAEFESFLDAFRGPFSVAAQLVTLAFAVYHSATWFNLTPRAMPVQVGETFLAGRIIAGAHYVAWLVFSIVVLFLAGVFPA